MQTAKRVGNVIIIASSQLVMVQLELVLTDVKMIGLGTNAILTAMLAIVIPAPMIKMCAQSATMGITEEQILNVLNAQLIVRPGHFVMNLMAIAIMVAFLDGLVKSAILDVLTVAKPVTKQILAYVMYAMVVCMGTSVSLTAELIVGTL